MIRRRADAASIKAKIGCHTFRATGITGYLENGGVLDRSQDGLLEDVVRLRLS